MSETLGTRETIILAVALGGGAALSDADMRDALRLDGEDLGPQSALDVADDLTRRGLLERRPVATRPGGVEYSATEAGRRAIVALFGGYEET